LSKDWWERKRPFSWFDIFEEFERMEEMMKKMMQRAFETTPKRARTLRPYIYGFSMSGEPTRKPVIRKFGNVQTSRLRPKIREEPLVDVMEEEKDVVIIAELPGVEKDDINLSTTEEHLTISVDTAQQKYRKELTLSARIDTKSAKTNYKNGVLEVRLRKLVEKGLTGERVFVE
jgi:HSP20 family protein